MIRLLPQAVKLQWEQNRRNGLMIESKIALSSEILHSAY